MELTVEHLHLSFFGHEECLHDINLAFGEGVTIVYGEHGSGKTALLKSIAHINDYTGEIALDGVPLKVGKDGDVCMVFDDLALFERRSLYYNLTYPLRLRGVPKAEWQERVAPLLTRWGLDKVFLDTPALRAPEEIRVRLALARTCLVARPILLLDNPLANLTPDERRSVFLDLSRYVREYRGVVLYATDCVEEAVSLDARLCVLSAGYLVAEGDVATLRRTVPTVYVATRLIPFWKAVEGVAEGGTVHTDEGDLAAVYPPTYEGKHVLAGISPTAYTLVEGDEYTVCDRLTVEGTRYSVLTKDGSDIVVERDLPLGARTSVYIEGRVPVYDIAGEWRIDGDKGEA